MRGRSKALASIPLRPRAKDAVHCDGAGLDLSRVKLFTI